MLLLKHRLYESLGHSAAGAAVKRPFSVIDVIAELPKQRAAMMMMEPVEPSASVAALSGQRSRTTSATYYQVTQLSYLPRAVSCVCLQAGDEWRVMESGFSLFVL